jgi:hypothetical protein
MEVLMSVPLRHPGLSVILILSGLLFGSAFIGGAPSLEAASIRDGNFADMVGGMPLTKADSYGKSAYLYSYCQW